MRCDRIYVMDRGQIIEEGTHQDLITLRGKYYELWKDQMPGLETDRIMAPQFAVGVGGG